MAEIIRKEAGSVGQIFDAAEQIARAWQPDPTQPQELWFRGQSEPHKLLPGLYRVKNAGYKNTDKHLMNWFKLRAVAFTGWSLNSDRDWDWYFLAQHHRLVTRLMDWTEALLAGVYFALCESMERVDPCEHYEVLKQSRNTPKYDDVESPVVWIMDAGSLNLFAFNEDCPYIPGGRYTKRYLPSQIGKRGDDNKNPIALLPSHLNARLIAQQSVFTVHGHETTSIDDLALKSSSPREIRLARIVLDMANLNRLWEDLHRAGVNRLTIFPELDSVACITNRTGH